MERRILVTGGSGHMGANLVRHLLHDPDCAVRVLVRPQSDNRALAGLAVEMVNGDLLDIESVRAAVRGCTQVYHAAALISIVDGRQREIYDTNVGGTRHVLQAACEAQVERVVVTGSLSAVGDHPTRPANEADRFYPFDQHLPYAMSKAFVEHECLRWVADGLDVVIATSCAIIGPNDYKPSRMGQVLIDFARGRLPAYLPGGFEFVSASDLAQGHVLAMKHGRRGQKYIFSTEFLTMDQLMAIFARVTGQRGPRWCVPIPVMAAVAGVSDFVLGRFAPAAPRRFTRASVRLLASQRHADCAKARQELGYRPTSIEEAVRDAYDCFRRRKVIP